VSAAWNAGLDAVHVERVGHEDRGRCVLGDRRVSRLDELLARRLNPRAPERATGARNRLAARDRNGREAPGGTGRMTKWLHSGRRRDLCALLYDAGELRAQSLKSRLESHYDERIDPRSFYATLTSLVESGFLDRRTEGLADVYARLPTLASAPSSTTTRGSRIGSMVGHPTIYRSTATTATTATPATTATTATVAVKPQGLTRLRRSVNI